MTLQQSRTNEPSLARDVSHAAGYCLRSRWTLIALASLAVFLGLYFGGWAWLVAAGLAPIILATLPCLIMCGLGMCMMGRGQGQSTAPRDAVEDSTSTALGAPDANGSSAAAASCCHGTAVETQPARLNQD